MWVALKGHYEFCHYDPDDNFLVMIRGRKQVVYRTFIRISSCCV